MKRNHIQYSLLSLFVFSLFSSVFTGTASAQAPQLMYHDFDSARKVAREQNLPILLHFYTDWCGPCRQMNQTVFSSPQLQTQMGGRVILVKVNAERATELARMYQVDTYPTDVFIDANGRMLSKLVGMASFQEFVRSGLEVADKYQKSQEILRDRKNSGKDPVPVSMWKIQLGEEGKLAVEAEEPNQPAQKQNAVPDPYGIDKVTADLEPEVVFLALDGFCPVSLKKNRQWTKGSEDFVIVHKQQRYQFTGNEELREFEQNPHEFAPRLLGCDPVIVWESDRAIPGSTAFAAYYNDELYLFTTEENRKLFELDPARYTNTRHVLAPRDVEATLIR